MQAPRGSAGSASTERVHGGVTSIQTPHWLRCTQPHDLTFRGKNIQPPPYELTNGGTTACYTDRLTVCFVRWHSAEKRSEVHILMQETTNSSLQSSTTASFTSKSRVSQSSSRDPQKLRAYLAALMEAIGMGLCPPRSADMTPGSTGEVTGGCGPPIAALAGAGGLHPHSVDAHFPCYARPSTARQSPGRNFYYVISGRYAGEIAHRHPQLRLNAVCIKSRTSHHNVAPRRKAAVGWLPGLSIT